MTQLHVTRLFIPESRKIFVWDLKKKKKKNNLWTFLNVEAGSRTTAWSIHSKSFQLNFYKLYVFISFDLNTFLNLTVSIRFGSRPSNDATPLPSTGGALAFTKSSFSNMANYRHEPEHVRGEARRARFIAPKPLRLGTIGTEAHGERVL